MVAVFALGEPLGFSLLIQKAKQIPTSRDAFRLPFYTQCYLFTPATLFLLPVIWITLRFNDHIPGGSIKLVFILSWVASLCWLLYAEVILIKAELNMRWFEAVGCFISYALISVFLVWFLELTAVILQGL